MGVRIGWAEFEAAAPPRDVVVRWAEFDVRASPRNVTVSWAEFDTQARPKLIDDLPTYAPGLTLSDYYDDDSDSYHIRISAEQEDEEQVVAMILLQFAAHFL